MTDDASTPAAPNADSYWASYFGTTPPSPTGNSSINGAVAAVKDAYQTYAAPLINGMSFGGTAGLDPATYAALRKQHPLLYPALETGGMMLGGGALASLAPEVAIPAGLARLGPMAYRLASGGIRAATAGAEGAGVAAASTGVVGGDPGKNALFGAAFGAGMPMVGSTIRSIAPNIAPGVALGAKRLMDLFGTNSASEALAKANNPELRKSAIQSLNGVFSQFAAKSGGIDMTTTIPEVVDPTTGVVKFPTQTVAARLNAIQTHPSLASHSTGVRNSVQEMIDGITSQVAVDPATGHPMLSPQAYADLTNPSALVGSKAMESNSTLRFLGGQTRHALDDALEINMPDDAAAIRTAREQRAALEQAPTIRGAIRKAQNLPEEPSGTSTSNIHAGGVLGLSILGAAGERLASPWIESIAEQHPWATGLGTLGGGLALGARYLPHLPSMMTPMVNKALGRYTAWDSPYVAAGAGAAGVESQASPQPDDADKYWKDYFGTSGQ